MARTSPNTLPFLLRRRESGGYLYHRRIPADVRPSLSGEVVCPWTGDVRLVGDGGTIRISFGTTDLATAKVRWSEIHAQVELIVGAAMRRGRRDPKLARRREVVRVASLTDQQIDVIAKRVEHRILADQAEKLLDPETFAPLPEQGLHHAMSRQERINALYWDHCREAEFAKSLRKGFDYAEPNRHLVMSTSRGLLDASQALQPGEKAILIPDEVTCVLRENGIDLPPNHLDRPRIAAALLAAKQRGHEAAVRRMEGDASVTPPDPGPVVIVAEIPVGARMTLSAAFEDWKSSRRPGPNTVLDYRSQVKRFISVHGDLAVGDITRQHITSFRDKMAMFPRGVPLELRNAPVDDVLAWARKTSAPTITITTVNDKCIGALSAIFALLVDQGSVAANPCSGRKFKLRDGDAKRRKPYDETDIARLLASPLYGRLPKIPKAACGAAGPRLPLLAMLTGSRLEELGQLRVHDVKEVDSISYFDMETFDATGGRIKRKTTSSRRNVPIHPMLVELGILRYVDAVRAAGKDRLFPGLVLTEDRYTANYSKWWGRYGRAQITTERAKCFHSFRHGFADALRDTDSGDALRERLMGHSNDSTFSRYGLGDQIRKLHAVIAQIRVPEVIEREKERLTLSLKRTYEH